MFKLDLGLGGSFEDQTLAGLINQIWEQLIKHCEYNKHKNTKLTFSIYADDLHRFMARFSIDRETDQEWGVIWPCPTCKIQPSAFEMDFMADGTLDLESIRCTEIKELSPHATA